MHIAILTFLLTLSCAISISILPTGAQVNFEGYIDKFGKWPKPTNIPVCWEPSVQKFPAEKQLVISIVRQWIEGHSIVRFPTSQSSDMWSDCVQQSQGIRIRIADEGPESHVGRQFDRDPYTGLIRKDNWGRPIVIPTKMTLNFTFKKTFKFCMDSRYGVDHCIQAIALHEFLHALGFLHEQIRPDADPNCKKLYAHASDVKGYNPTQYGKYDVDSHMNYCENNMYRKPIRLSKLDIEVLTQFYDTQ